MDIPKRGAWLVLLFCLPSTLLGGNPRTPDSWIPARWPGGPLELYQRDKARDQSKAPTADTEVRTAIADWYDPATLRLLDGSPVNCLLLTWSAGASAELERQQQQLVGTYATEAHRRGVAILGLVYPGADPSQFVPAAIAAHLDGLALEGGFPGDLIGQVTTAVASSGSPMVVVPIVTAPARTAATPVSAVEGVSPSARNLSDMGIRGAPSSEPWIQSNIWLVRSFRLTPDWRPLWIGYQPDSGTASDYARSVADAAVAGGRWIVALDDRMRAKLRRRDAAALATWSGIGECLKFAEDHAEWRSFVPFGNLGIILDPASKDPDMADEYLKLVARRQVPYRLIARTGFNAASLAGLRAVLATELAPPTDAERTILQAFAENGGVLVAGPSWGNPPKDQPFAEVSVGKGRAVVYKDPDPESVARDMRDLLSHKEAGFAAFNVPSVITYASGGPGKRLLVQLLNYSDFPATAITIRVSGSFKTARLFTPGAAPLSLDMDAADGQIDVAIPKLSLWGAVLLE